MSNILVLLLSCTITDVAAFRAKLTDRVESAAGRAIKQAAAHESSYEQDVEAPSVGAMANKIIARQCMVEKAAAYPSLLEKFGNALESNQTDVLERAVITKIEFEDKISNHLAQYSSSMKQLISRYRSSTIAKWNDEIAVLEKQITESGFQYETVMDRCRAGEDHETHACVIDSSPPGLKEPIEAQMAAEEMLSHQRAWARWLGSSNTAFRNAQIALDAAKAQIKAYDSDHLAEAKSACHKTTQSKTSQFYSYVRKQLRVTKEVGTPPVQQCLEDEEKGYCPEGTEARSGRDFDPAKGAQWFAIGYFGAWASTAITWGFAWALAASAGGPLAMAAAFPTGFLAGNLMAPTTLSGSILFAWNAIGPYECACFPRDCMRDEVKDACVLGNNATVGANPYARSLPYMGMKCIPTAKETGCVLQACLESDYAGASGIADLFGKVGAFETGLYNCLSTSGSSMQSLAVQVELPGGRSNTAMNRNDLYMENRIPVTKDD